MMTTDIEQGEAPAPEPELKKRLTFDDVIVGLSYVADDIRDCKIALGSVREHRLEVVNSAARLIARFHAESKGRRR